MSASISGIYSEACFNIDAGPVGSRALDGKDGETLRWLLRETFQPEALTAQSVLRKGSGGVVAVVEVGPRMSFTTAWSTNAVLSLIHI